MEKSMMRVMTVCYAVATLTFASFAAAEEDEPQFVIAGDNTNEAIATLEETGLIGLSIEEIENKARPCAISDWPDCSTAGFLGPEESFIERLIIDNTYVHDQGFTHIKLAEPLFAAVLAAQDVINEWITFGYNGVQYQVYKIAWHGYQESIFNDPYRTNVDYQVRRDGEEETILDFSGMIPDYIQDYGFYEGETSYRVAPAQILEMFFQR